VKEMAAAGAGPGVPDVAECVEAVFGCKWSIRILTLIRRGVCRPGEIERSLAQRSDEETLLLMRDRDGWLSANRLFLPGSFPEKWAALRLTVEWMVGHIPEGPRDQGHIHDLRMKALRLAKDAFQEIYQDMGLEPGRLSSVRD